MSYDDFPDKDSTAPAKADRNQIVAIAREVNDWVSWPPVMQRFRAMIHRWREEREREVVELGHVQYFPEEIVGKAQQYLPDDMTYMRLGSLTEKYTALAAVRDCVFHEHGLIDPWAGMNDPDSLKKVTPYRVLVSGVDHLTDADQKRLQGALAEVNVDWRVTLRPTNLVDAILDCLHEHERDRRERQYLKHRDDGMPEEWAREFAARWRADPPKGADESTIRAWVNERWPAMTAGEVKAAIEEGRRLGKIIREVWKPANLLTDPDSGRDWTPIPDRQELRPGEEYVYRLAPAEISASAAPARQSHDHPRAPQWQPPAGFVGVKTICSAAEWRKNGKNPPRTTIGEWIKRSEREGISVEKKKASDSHEVFLPEIWVREQLARWNPRRP